VPSPRFFLDPSCPAEIERHLRELGWLENDHVLSAEKIVGGNMNLTVRLRMEQHTGILKQARPWVEKYPDIAAPVGRAIVEAAFYLAVTSEPAVSGRMPALLGADANSCMLFLEDLHDATDLTSLYAGSRLSPAECEELIEYLNALHTLEVEPDRRDLFRNREMRELNHQHQYDLPLRHSKLIDLDRITPGLDSAADQLKNDATYCSRVAELGRLYLGDGETLLHGDYFPGSWLRTPLALFVIDPEFCFLGCREYDLGILYAHLILIHQEDVWTGMRERYAGTVDWKVVDGFAGAELMRRLIGVAQLPLRVDLDCKRAWLELSRRLVCDPGLT
jgi:5-methylthioribose kinase